jgi:hypothetical protein
MIGDRVYDSDPLDARLEQQYGIELIAPHKINRSRPPPQDGRKLRRYKTELLWAWLKTFKRAATRWVSRVQFPGMVPLACMLILLRHF